MLTDRDISTVFDATFAECNVNLRGGASAPYYLPSAAPGEPARVFYTLDYPASALHEAAHWLRAGAERRCLPDYGYWYVDEPRPAPVQRAFLSVEANVQALECVLSQAAGLGFRVSVDDFSMSQSQTEAFEQRVRRVADRLVARGLPARADQFRAALQHARACRAA